MEICIGDVRLGVYRVRMVVTTLVFQDHDAAFHNIYAGLQKLYAGYHFIRRPQIRYHLEHFVLMAGGDIRHSLRATKQLPSP